MKMSQLPGWAGRAGTWLLDLLFPMKCPFCQHILEDSRAPACPGCQKMLPWLSGREAERPVEFTSGCLSPLAYRDRVPDSIHRYKFPGTPSYAGALWPAHRPVCPGQPRRPSGSGDLDPPQPQTEAEAGLRPGGGPGAGCRRELDLPVRGTLEKFRNNDPQSHLHEASERRANVLGVYRLKESVDLAGLRVLLVDDVVTSGATLSECARGSCALPGPQRCSAPLWPRPAGVDLEFPVFSLKFSLFPSELQTAVFSAMMSTIET